TAGVLLHLQGGGGHATGVRGLARRVEDPRVLEGLDRARLAGHVRALGDELHAVADQGVRVLRGQLVLRGARQRHVAGNLPDAALGDVGGAAAGLDVVGEPAAADLLDLPEELQVDPLLVHDVATGVGDRHDRAAELVDLLHGVDGDIARPGDDDPAPLE